MELINGNIIKKLGDLECEINCLTEMLKEEKEMDSSKIKKELSVAKQMLTKFKKKEGLE